MTLRTRGRGDKSSVLNVSNAPLLASAEFTGGWEINEWDHALVNCKADEDCTVFVEVGIPYTDEAGVQQIETTFSAGLLVLGGQSFIRPIVKAAGSYNSFVSGFYHGQNSAV